MFSVQRSLPRQPRPALRRALLRRRRHRERGERGQVSIAMVVVVILVLMMISGLVGVGRAAIDRSRARTAADATVLAHAVDSAAGNELRAWYGAHGVSVDATSGWAHAASGRAQAAAWARAQSDGVTAAPATAAIVSRAEQLLGVRLASQVRRDTSLWLSAADGHLFAGVATGLGMCLAATEDASTRFDLC